MGKLEREMSKLIENEGCLVLNVSRTNGCHTAYKIAYLDCQKTFIGPSTPSDRRAKLNFRTDLRKWMRAARCKTN